MDAAMTSHGNSKIHSYERDFLVWVWLRDHGARATVAPLGLIYGPDEIAAAAKQANMRGRDSREFFAGIEQRDWFVRRVDRALGDGDGDGDWRMLATEVHWAHRLAAIGPLTRGTTWRFRHDPCRTKLRRHWARTRGVVM